MKRCEAKWLLAACLALGLWPFAKVQAQTFEEGYQSYMRNQFPVAELQFRSAVKKAKTREDRAFILKFIGICQFMRGDKKTSATTFYEALTADRNVTIDEEEVLDPGVVSFFNVIKTRWMNSPEGMAAGSASKAPAQPAPKPGTGTVAQTRPAATPEVPAAVPKAVAQTPAPAAVPIDKTRKKKITAGKPEEGSRIISFMHFMPFGLGQFSNESYLLGSAFAVGQVYSLYQIMNLGSQIDRENKQNTQVRNNPNVLQADKDKFLLDNEDYISGLKKDKTSAVTFFAALYVGSVAEALIFAPRSHSTEAGTGPETSKKKSGKSIKTAWLPNTPGGTWLVQLKLDLD